MAHKIGQGNAFASSVYRDTARLLLAHTAGSALSVAPVLTPAAVQTLIDASEDPAASLTSRANGLLGLGPADSVEINFFGTDADNETFTYQVSRLAPCVEGETIVAWMRSIEVAGAGTLGASTAGAAGAAITGIATGDFAADTLSQTIITPSVTGVLTHTVDAVESNSHVSQAQTPSGLASVQVAGRGSPYLLLEVVVGTAATVAAIARRVAGSAKPC